MIKRLVMVYLLIRHLLIYISNLQLIFYTRIHDKELSLFIIIILTTKATIICHTQEEIWYLVIYNTSGYECWYFLLLQWYEYKLYSALLAMIGIYWRTNDVYLILRVIKRTLSWYIFVNHKLNFYYLYGTSNV